MISRQLKLRLTKDQEAKLDAWLWNLSAVYNWGIRKIELNAKDKIYFSGFDFQNLLSGHSTKLQIPSHVLQGTLKRAHHDRDINAARNVLYTGLGLSHEGLAFKASRQEL